LKTRQEGKGTFTVHVGLFPFNRRWVNSMEAGNSRWLSRLGFAKLESKYVFWLIKTPGDLQDYELHIAY
jgi:hypothetical protein